MVDGKVLVVLEGLWEFGQSQPKRRKRRYDVLSQWKLVILKMKDGMWESMAMFLQNIGTNEAHYVGERLES